MMPPSSGAKGWFILAAYVVAWDALAKETLSCAFLRRRTHPVIVLAWSGLSAHLFGVLPRRYDPLYLTIRYFRGSAT